MVEIETRLAKVRQRMAEAAIRVGRNPDKITLVAATKTRTVEEIRLAMAAGVAIIGENRVQEADKKFPHIPSGTVEWHLIGHLQSNKINKALELFSLIHSVDSLPLAAAISKRALSKNKCIDILIEVNTSGEDSKFGVAPENTIELVRQASTLEAIQILGLMTIGPFLEDGDDIRPCFVRLRELRDEIANLKLPNVIMKHLSMGMTNDFEIAIEEGATLVRIGTAIFGPRQ